MCKLTKGKIVVNKEELESLISYVHSLLEFIDVNDLSKKNKNIVINGYDEYVLPMTPTTQNFESPHEYAYKKEVELFLKNLESIYEVDISKYSDEEIEEMFDEVQDELANADDYNEIYNDCVWSVINKHKK